MEFEALFIDPQNFPADWRVTRFPDLVFFQEGPGIRNWQFVERDGVRFVNIRCLEDGRLVTSKMSQISWEEAYGKYSHFLLNANDFVVSSSGTLGRVATVQEVDLPCCLNTSVIRMRPANERLNRGYLKYFLLSDYYKNQILAFANGSAQLNYGPTHLKQMEIVAPPIAEQRAIAHILGTLDDKIELNRKTNETLEAMAKALFKSWFVDFDPVRAKAEGRPTGLPAEISDLFPDSFEDSELGVIPSGWEPRTIREWGRTECGKAPSTHNQAFYGDDYMFVTIPDLHNGLHVISSGKRLSKLGADSQSKKLLPPGSVMISCIATPGLVGVARKGCFTNQQINSIIPNSKEASWFLALAKIENRDLLLSLGGGGSVFFNLSKGRFDEIEMLAPSEDLIGAYDEVVSALMDRYFATKQEIIALTNVRDTLLPKLISGEIRIPDAEQMLEEVGV
ncbi:MAG: restriction endonuclease subunit S [Cyanobium sp.]